MFSTKSFCAIVAPMTACAAQPALAQDRSFDVAAQPAVSAIPTFARQAGVQIVAPASGLAGRRTRAVRGRHTVDAGLMLLLRGTGLHVVTRSGPIISLAFDAPTSAPTRKRRDAALGEAVGKPRSSDDAQDREAKVNDGDVIVTGVHDKSFRNDVAQVGVYRNQTLLDTPMTVTVINRALLDAQNAQGLDDALRNVAGVTQQGNSPLTANSYVARGVPANARTNFRLNGTLPIINYEQIPIENKERVEALKGVSALYYGFTTPSIIVNLVTKRAGSSPVTAVKLDSDVEGSYGAALDIGRTFGPARLVGVRLNGYAGHLETPINGIRGYRWLTSGAFDLRPTDRLSLQFDVEHYERKIGETGSLLLPSAVGAVNGIGGTITLPPIPNPHNAYAPTDAAYYARSTNVLGRINYTIADGWSAHLDGGIARLHRERWSVDIGNTNLATGASTLTGNRSSDENVGNTGGRLEINGLFRTGPIRHEILLGYSFNHLAETGKPSATFATTQNLYTPYPIVSANLVFTTKGTTSYQYTHDSGFYGLDMAHLGERLILIGGLRQEKFTFNKINGTQFRLTTVTPTLGIVFHPVSRVSLYSTYIEGLESAGTAPLGTTNAGDTLTPLVSRQAEAGVKVEAGKALFTAAYFHINRALAYTNAANTYVSDGRAVYQGVEASLQGTLGHGFSTALSGQYLNAIQQKTSVAAQNGKPVTNAPRYAVAAFLDYHPERFAAFGLNAGVYYTGRRSADLQERVTLPDYTLVSLGASYLLKLREHQSVTFRVSADNLFDKRYWATAGDTHLYIGLPRVIRFTATTAF